MTDVADAPIATDPAQAPHRPEAGPRATRHSLSRLFWIVVSLLLVLLMLGRFVIFWHYEAKEAWVPAGLLLVGMILLYVSFLTEGIILAASKVEEYDDTAITRTMNREFGGQDAIGSVLLFVKENMTQILIGQPLVAIGVTLLFDTIMEAVGLHMQHDGSLVSAQAAQELPAWLVYLMTSSIVSGVLSAGLVYWVAQLLPQTLGKSNAIAFMRLWGAWPVARVLVFIAQSGIGLPSTLMGGWFGGEFRRQIDVPVGDARIFDSVCLDVGYYIDKRIITIEPEVDKTTVTDEIVYVYLDDRIEIRHSCRVPIDQFNAGVDFTLDVSDHTSLEQPRMNLFQMEVLHAEPTTAGTAQLTPVYQERVYVIESSADKKPDRVTTRARYIRDPLTLAHDRADSFVFDMGVPTRQIDIRIQHLDGVVINTPPRLLFLSEIARFSPEVSPLTRGTPRRAKDAAGWFVGHIYPPFSAEMRLRVDARAAIHTQR